MEPLQQGEELTISYLDMVTNTVTRHQRQEYLATHFMFQCQCPLCSMSPDQVEQDDQIREQVKTLTLSLKNDKTANPADQIKVISEIQTLMTKTSYPPSTKWPFYLSLARF